MMIIQAKFLKPFADGTFNTLKTACQMEAKYETIFTRGNAPQPQFDIAGILSLSSGDLSGTLTICFPKKTYLKIMEKMLGDHFEEITTELQDGAAEILNMIFGFAKVILNEQGHSLEKAIPTVILGENLKKNHTGGVNVYVIAFQCEAGPFHLEISATEKTKP